MKTVTDGTAPPSDRRSTRHEGTRSEIIAAAWGLVRENGLAGLAMRDLGERVGMRAQSIYSYFPSKLAIFDAMFREAYTTLSVALEAVGADPVSEGREYARVMSHRYFDFCVEDPVRFQLLFLRTIPDFVPSEESYAVAIRVYESMTSDLTRIGITDAGAADLLTALLTGLASQQIANDPGGDRWRRLVDRSIDMYLREVAPNPTITKTKRRRS